MAAAVYASAVRCGNGPPGAMAVALGAAEGVMPAEYDVDAIVATGGTRVICTASHSLTDCVS